MLFTVDPDRIKTFLQDEWNKMTSEERAFYRCALDNLKHKERFPLEAACRAIDFLDGWRAQRDGLPIAAEFSPEYRAALSRYGGANGSKPLTPTSGSSDEIGAYKSNLGDQGLLL